MTQQRGFTLVELIVVIVITAILAAMSFTIIQLPFVSYAQAESRMTLTNRASVALIQMAREVRSALPNSLRTNGTALELLRTRGAARYRSEVPGTPLDLLSFSTPDVSFNVHDNPGAIGANPGLRLSVYPLGVPGANPYVDNVLTPALAVLNIASVASPMVGYDNEFRITMAPAHLFPLESPARRIYLVDGPSSHVCTGDEIRHYQGYALQAAQPVVPADFPSPGTVVLKGVSTCSFTYSNLGANEGLLTLRFSLNERGQTINLVQQVHVENTP